MIKTAVDWTFKVARRIAVVVVGSTLLALGVGMIVTPGPALIVIPIGLAILSIEFAWARMWLQHVRRKISDQTSTARADRAAGYCDRVNR